MEQQKFKIQVPDGCSAKIEQQDGFLVVVFEQKKWEPKDGDIVAFGSNKEALTIAIFESNTADNTFSAHIVYNGKLNSFKPGWIKKNFRPATEEEKQRLFDALAKAGKRWNAEEKRIEDLPRWRAKRGNMYYTITRNLTVDNYYENGEATDEKLYFACNYFKTREAAEKVAKQLREIFKNSKAE